MPCKSLLTSQQGRKRALDRAMDEAVRNPNARRGKKKDEIVSFNESVVYLLQANNILRIFRNNKTS